MIRILIADLTSWHNVIKHQIRVEIEFISNVLSETCTLTSIARVHVDHVDHTYNLKINAIRRLKQYFEISYMIASWNYNVNAM